MTSHPRELLRRLVGHFPCPARRRFEVRHPVFARLYPRLSRAMDRGGMAERRHALVAGLNGHVLELGCGSGDMFVHYPASVLRVTAVEPEPHLRHLARRAAGGAAVPIDVVDAVAQRLPAEDGSVDAVVACLVLCTVPDADAALGEIHRVLTPGGQLRFLEHVRADSVGLARMQRLLDRTVWPRLAGGCHTGRDTTAAMTRTGFHIEALERFLFPERPSPVSLHVTGTARPMAGTQQLVAR